MAKIYKCSDRIKIKIDDVVVTIAPLSLDQKTEAQELMARGKINKDYKMITKGIVATIRYALKDISGLEDSEGQPYKLEFEDNILSESCINDLFNIQLHQKLVMVCSSLLGNFPTDFRDENGNLIEGVEFLSSKNEEKQDPN